MIVDSAIHTFIAFDVSRDKISLLIIQPNLQME